MVMTDFKTNAMKKLLPLILLIVALNAKAQVPQQINYQGVARNSVGSVIPNQNITLRLSIREGNATGTVLYRESRALRTNSFGLFVTAIGASGATAVSGVFTDINWGTGIKFLQVEIDPTGGSNFIDAGTAQLLSVPYAIYANTAGTASPIGNAGGDLTGTFPNPVIKDGAITASKLETGLIPTSLPPTGGAGGDLTGNYPNPSIKSGIINNSKLADNAVGTSKIQNGSITAIKLAPGLIPTSLPPIGDAGGDLAGTYPNPTIGTGVITGNKIALGTITADKLAPGVIPSSLPLNGTAGGDLTGNYPNPSIATGAISNIKLSDNSVSTTKVQDGAITLNKLAPGLIPSSLPPTGNAGGDLTGTYPNPTITNGAVSTNKIADYSVTSLKLADNSVNTSHIVDASITSSKIASGVIPTSLPPTGNAGGDLSGTYPNPLIANNAITSQKLSDGSVTNTKIGDNEISTSKIQDGAITASKLDPSLLIAGGGGSPTGSAGGDLNGTYPNPTVNKIQGVTVGSTAPASGQVLKFNGTAWVPSTDNVASFGSNAGGDLSGTYPDPNIASGAVTASKIANGAVNTPKLSDGAVTTNKIADNSITTIKIVDGAITSGKLAPGLIPTTLPPSGTAGGDLTGSYPNPTVGAGMITTTKLADNSITTLKIADGSVTSSKLAAGLIPTSLPPNGAAGGDLNGNYPNPTVNKIQGVGISVTAPTTGQVLTFNGTQWIASTPGSSGLSLPYSSVVNSALNLLSITNSGTGAGLEGINSSTSSNVSGIIGQISSNTPGTMSAGLKGINNGNGTNGIGVYGLHSGNGYGVYGNSVGGTGVYGNSTSGFGVLGNSASGAAIGGTSTSGNAGFFNVSNASNSNDAVFISNYGQGNGLTAQSENSNGIVASTNNPSFVAIQAFNNAGAGTSIWGLTYSTNSADAAIKATNVADGGTALIAELDGVSTGNIAVFKNGTNKARIDANGKGYFNGGTVNSGADVAETFDVEGSYNDYEPGDVLIISRSSDRKVEKSQSSYSTLVAGVYATKPGVILTEKDASQDQLSEMVPMGVIGVIPTKVCTEGGAIKRGDLLVTSSVGGVAMKADLDKVKVGQVIGKALEDYNANGTGKIKVLVSIK